MRLLLLNLWRKPLRTLLTVFGVGVALFLFCFLEAVLTAFNAGVNMSDASRLVVQHKESIMFELPSSYRARIEQIEGVTGVASASWIGALSQEPGPDGKKREEFFAQFATEIDRYLALYPEVKVPPDQLRDLMNDQMGCLLGAKIAERLRKKIGDRLVLRSTIWAQKNGSSLWEFNVRAIYTTDSPTFDQTIMVFHHKRFDEARQFGQGYTGLYLVSIADPNRSTEIAAAIDARFANSPFETRTMTEKAFNIQFVGMIGNFQLLLRSIGSAIVLTMLLVSANTMMMSARERTREMGILKAIGFTDGHVFALLIGEAMAMALLGALAGVGLAWLLANVIQYNPKPDFFPVFYLPGRSMLAATGLAALTGLASGIVPAVAGMRLKATEALRSV
ncbi:MAG: FtsX-like permease family protein [Thermoguttaceae bacterium]|jgi:putative ABC transport system permease protein|nr:FtsX-like permease family protein [Thermoguttaceae bacterium]